MVLQYVLFVYKYQDAIVFLLLEMGVYIWYLVTSVGEYCLSQHSTICRGPTAPMSGPKLVKVTSYLGSVMSMFSSTKRLWELEHGPCPTKLILSFHH